MFFSYKLRRVDHTSKVKEVLQFWHTRGQTEGFISDFNMQLVNDKPQKIKDHVLTLSQLSEEILKQKSMQKYLRKFWIDE